MKKYEEYKEKVEQDSLTEEQRLVMDYMRARCLKGLHHTEDAFEAFQLVIDNQEQVQAENYIVPFSYLHQGEIAMNTKEWEKAGNLWEQATDFSGYDFE